MKKILFNKLTAAVLLAVSILPTSCIEEGEDEVNGQGNNYIRIVATHHGESEINIAPASFDAEPSTATFLEIRRDAISNSDLNEAVSVTFEVNDAIVTTYNAWVVEYNAYVDDYNKPENLDTDGDGDEDLDPLDHEVEYNILDPTVYTIGQFSVDFAPGEFVKFVPLTLDPTVPGKEISFTQKYGLGITITSASNDYTVMQHGNNVMVDVIVKNPYDGIYDYTGNIYRYGGDGAALNDGLDGKVADGVTITLVTTGATTVEMVEPVWVSGTSGIGGIGDPVIQVDETTNLVTIIPVGAAPANWQNIPGEPSYYDPAEKKIYLNWKWGASAPSPIGTTRGFRLVLEYKGPR